MTRTWRSAAIALAAAVALMLAGCGGASGLFRQYEYEEDIYLSLDGTATIYVNSSVAALDALRGRRSMQSGGASIAMRPRLYSAGHACQAKSLSRAAQDAGSSTFGSTSTTSAQLGSAPFHWSSYAFVARRSLRLSAVDRRGREQTAWQRRMERR
jgi:hypothetical protein